MQPADLLRIGPTAFLLGMGVAALSGSLALHLVKQLARSRRVRRAARAQHAERAAALVLERAGYTVLGRQVRRAWSVLADGQEVSFDLIADYLVEAAGTAWVAEVKTGERALSLLHGPTRRQLLEYRHAFGVEGVLLVDAEAQRVRRIQFREPTQRARASRALLWLALGLVLGVALSRYWPEASLPR
jgi:hypothetical protein